MFVRVRTAVGDKTQRHCYNFAIPNDIYPPRTGMKNRFAIGRMTTALGFIASAHSYYDLIRLRIAAGLMLVRLSGVQKSGGRIMRQINKQHSRSAPRPTTEAQAKLISFMSECMRGKLQ